ncbi:hypothetical protein AXF42_Ash009439 [Apostasia shenzhenica]|uniref:Uncharacterized protein n=1 Tax=Apostasia shenzhenica TaxID=1088818 RepID=A0A2I0B8W7_9ASPA|nr:hypothetical protein AXF42_Ash009439 [Apostasia shenzhenica]
MVELLRESCREKLLEESCSTRGFREEITPCRVVSCLDHELGLREGVLEKSSPLIFSRRAAMVVSWDFEKGFALDYPSPSCLDHELGLREGVLEEGLPLTLSRRGTMIVSWDFEKGFALDCPSPSRLDHELGLREGIFEKRDLT